MKRLYLYGIVLALAFAAVTVHWHVSTGQRLWATAIICAAAWGFLTARQKVKLRRDTDKLTRRWARAMFARGFMSMEELNLFYETHPEVEDLDS